MIISESKRLFEKAQQLYFPVEFEFTGRAFVALEGSIYYKKSYGAFILTMRLITLTSTNQQLGP